MVLALTLNPVHRNDILAMVTRLDIPRILFNELPACLKTRTYSL